MTLILSVTSYQNQTPARPLVGQFDSPSISIGRGADNDWPLPDPEVHLSKKHCLIQCRDGEYIITDISTNGVFINGSPRPLGNGGTAVLQRGDRLLLGDYEVLVDIRAAAAAAPMPPAASAFPPAGPPEDPFGLADIIGGGTGHPASPMELGGGGPFTAASTPTPALIGDDWLRDFDPIPRSGYDANASPPPATQADHAPAVDGFFRLPNVAFDAAPTGPAVIPDDWQSGAEARGPKPELPAARPTPLPPPAPASSAVVPNHFAREPVAPPSVAPAPQLSAVPQRAAVADAGWTEFLSAAGLDPALFAAENPVDLMRALGRVFREMVAGLRDLLATRDNIKTEYRIQRTVVQAANNNPIKFAIDVEQAAAMLLARPRPGYLVGAKAVNDSFRDMKAHEIAFMVGMQSAVAALLKQFDPEIMKQRIDRQKGWDSLLPGARQSKYWSAYEEQYRQIATEISEDARSVFGQAFARAYEEQSKKL